MKNLKLALAAAFAVVVGWVFTASAAASYSDALISANGGGVGRIDIDGGYVYVFSNSVSVTMKAALQVERILLVGGGGAGGTTIGGGGGGGGIVSETFEEGERISMSAGSVAEITVGVGGLCQQNLNASGMNWAEGGSGSNTVFTFGETVLTAVGGGGGGCYGKVGLAGGCGGGSGTSTSYALGSQGGNGSKGYSNSYSGGGGGGGGDGGYCDTSTLTCGAGGIGFLSDITGAEVYYAGGGGGGAGNDSKLGGVGGLGGGGIGGNNGAADPGGNGVDGLGGGGGGGSFSPSRVGGMGGKGVAIIRVKIDQSSPLALPELLEHGWAYARLRFQVVAQGTGAQSSRLLLSVAEEGGTEAELTEAAAGLATDTGFVTNVVGLIPGKSYVCRYAVENNLGVYSSVGEIAFAMDAFGSPGTGGEISQIGSDYLHVFRYDNGDPAVFSISEDVTAWLLLVGGGGAGGHTIGAGGGAGGFIEARDVVLAAGQYTVTVGGGGVSTVATLCGGNGGNTEIVSPAGSMLYSALGGSGGTSWSSAAQSSPGGSGGGGGGEKSSVPTGGSGTEGQGHAGGKKDNRSPGGGGGAGEAGADGAYGSSNSANPGQAGKGGDGLASSISGEDVYYAGGGGGGGSAAATFYYRAGAGGLGGGGDGSTANSGQPGGDGTDGLGGGGGGGSFSPATKGGKGGDGILMIRYQLGGASSEPEDPRFTLVSVSPDGEGNIAFAWNLSWAGRGCDTADVYVSWGASESDLSHTELLQANVIGTGSDTFSFGSETVRAVKLTVRNARGRSVESAVVAVFSVDDHWTYDVEHSVISDGATAWDVSKVGEGMLKVRQLNPDRSTVPPYAIRLDFSKPCVATDNTSWTLMQFVVDEGREFIPSEWAPRINGLAFGDATEKIGAGCFQDRFSSVRGRLTIPASLAKLEAGVFKGMTSLSEVEFLGPCAVTGKNALSGLRAVTNIVGSAFVTAIGEAMHDLVSYSMPTLDLKGATSFGKDALINLGGNPTIVLGDNVASFAGNVWPYVITNFPGKSLVSITGDRNFAGATFLLPDGKLVFPRGFRVLSSAEVGGVGVFSNARGIRMVDFPTSYNNIASNAFRSVDGLEEVNIRGRQLGTVGAYAFGGPDLKRIYFHGSLPAKIAANFLKGIPEDNVVEVYVKRNRGWEAFADNGIIPGTITYGTTQKIIDFGPGFMLFLK